MIRSALGSVALISLAYSQTPVPHAQAVSTRQSGSTQVQKPALAIAAAAPSPTARISPAVLESLERSFDGSLQAIDINLPVDILMDTRSVQVPDYGVVFTSEISLTLTHGNFPIRMPAITDTQKAVVHTQKLERLPKVIDKMKEMVKMSAMTLEGKMPDSQQVVLAVRVRHLVWEDLTGLPTRQILMRADRKSASQGDIKTEID